MSDETVVVDEPEKEQTLPDDSGNELSVDDKIKAAIEGVSTQFKNQISGLDRRNSELEKELEEERKAHMSDKERLEYEKAQRDEQLEKKSKELLERELALEKASVVTELDVPKNLVKFVTGKDRDSLEANAKELMVAFLEAVGNGVDKKLLSGGPKPEGGGGKPDTRNRDELIIELKAVQAMRPTTKQEMDEKHRKEAELIAKISSAN